MQLKKSPKADLESWRSAALFLGVTFASAIVLCAFEWRSPKEEKKHALDYDMFYLVDEVVLASFPEKPKKQHSAPKPIKATDLITFQPIDEVSFPDIDFSISDEPSPIEIPVLIETFDEPIVLAPDVPAEFPGGMEALYRYLSTEITYPKMAKDAGIMGKVFLQFTVNKEGNISDVKVLRGLGGGIEQEALRVVHNMPDWTPAKHRGRPVNSIFTLPISFLLNN